MNEREKRVARENRARERAEAIGPGDYSASGPDVCDNATRATVLTCESHWDACLVMIEAAHMRAREGGK